MSASILKGVSDEFLVNQKVKVYGETDKPITVPCKFRFRRPNTASLTELGREIGTAVSKSDFVRLGEILRENLIGWNIPGSDGENVEFNDENVDLVLDHPDYLTGLVDAFAKVLNPGAGKAKN
jgi:hypothetical protein